MMGAGGAMMLWRLAWLRAFPDMSAGLPTPYTPSIMPMPRGSATRENLGSWKYHDYLRKIEMLTRVWPYDGRPSLLLLDGPRHNLNTDIAA